MSVYRDKFEEKLQALDDVEVRAWKESSELICVFYRGKEFAHFQDNEIIDVRLSTKFIRQERISPLEDSPYHQNRSKKSRWVQFRFTAEQDTLDLVALIKRLLEAEYENTAWGNQV